MVTIYIIHSAGWGSGGRDRDHSQGSRGGGTGTGSSTIPTGSDCSCRIVVMIGFVGRFIGAHTVIRIAVASRFRIVSVTIVAIVIVMIRVLIVVCDGCRCGCFVIGFGRTLGLGFLLEFTCWTSCWRCIAVGGFRLVWRILRSRRISTASKCYCFVNGILSYVRVVIGFVLLNIYLIEIDCVVLLVFVENLNFRPTNCSHDPH